MAQVLWKEQPDEHDYPAAVDYLELLTDSPHATLIADDLRQAPIVFKKAKDILRAAGLRLLSADNPHVASDLKAIGKGKALSPILLVRGRSADGQSQLGAGYLQVADGYHRVCASYLTDENTPIPAKLVGLRAQQPPAGTGATP